MSSGPLPCLKFSSWSFWHVVHFSFLPACSHNCLFPLRGVRVPRGQRLFSELSPRPGTSQLSLNGFLQHCCLTGEQSKKCLGNASSTSCLACLKSAWSFRCSELQCGHAGLFSPVVWAWLLHAPAPWWEAMGETNSPVSYHFCSASNRLLF